MSEATPTGAYTIREATWRDFFKLHRLEKLCFQADSWPWIDILAALTFPETIRLVAEQGEALIGFAIGDRRRQREMGWIASIGVHPDLRKQGIGRALLQACERDLDIARIRLSLRPTNQPALLLYRTAGYVEIDRWPRYYRDGEDAIVMEKRG